MKAYAVTKLGQPLEHCDLAKPTPGPHQVLVKLRYSGVCHTDLHVAKGDLGEIKTPRIPGHEGVGIVEEIGSKVTTVKVGDRVGIAWLGESCLSCELCQKKLYNLCPNQLQTGFSKDGSFAEYAIGHEKFVGRIPDALTDAEAAPVLCAGVTAYKGLKLANLSKKDVVVISGACGGLGHMGVQIAKHMGFVVVALDYFSEESRSLLESKGVDYIVDLSSGKSPTELISSLENGKLFISASIIFAPSMKAYAQAVEYTSPGGTIVAISLPAGKLEIDLVQLILKQLRIQGSIVGNPEDLQEVLQLFATTSMKPSVKVQAFETVNSVLHKLEHEKVTGRIVLQVTN